MQCVSILKRLVIDGKRWIKCFFALFYHLVIRKAWSNFIKSLFFNQIRWWFCLTPPPNRSRKPIGSPHLSLGDFLMQLYSDISGASLIVNTTMVLPSFLVLQWQTKIAWIVCLRSVFVSVVCRVSSVEASQPKQSSNIKYYFHFISNVCFTRDFKPTESQSTVS